MFHLYGLRKYIKFIRLKIDKFARYTGYSKFLIQLVKKHKKLIYSVTHYEHIVR